MTYYTHLHGYRENDPTLFDPEDLPVIEENTMKENEEILPEEVEIYYREAWEIMHRYREEHGITIPGLTLEEYLAEVTEDWFNDFDPDD